jgi:hypothetical protein
LELPRTHGPAFARMIHGSFGEKIMAIRHDFTATEPVELVEHRKINWRAILVGSVITLGIQAWFLYLGSALGLSSFNADRAATFGDASIWGPIAFLLVTAFLSSTAGAWICGHWANLYSSEDALMHGGATWALSAIMIALALAVGFGLGSSAVQSGATKAQASANAPGQEKGAQEAGSLAYDRLNDAGFARFLSQQAKAYAGREGVAMNVSAKSETDAHRVDPKAISKDYELQRFVMTETGMDQNDAKNFLKDRQEAIAQAAADSQRQWELTHARDIAKAENARRDASQLAWTMTALGLLTLAASLAASYGGWMQRYGKDDEIAVDVNPNHPHTPHDPHDPIVE